MVVPIAELGCLANHCLLLSQQFERRHRGLDDLVDQVQEESAQVALLHILAEHKLPFLKQLQCQQVHVVRFRIFWRELV